jgi:hypothetical protein
MLRNEGRWGPGCLEVRATASVGVPDREASGGPAGRRFGRPATSESAARGRGLSRGYGTLTRGHGPASASGYSGAAVVTCGGALERGARLQARRRAFQQEPLRCRRL